MGSRWWTAGGRQQVAETDSGTNTATFCIYFKRVWKSSFGGWGLQRATFLDCLYELTLIAEDLVILTDS